MQLKTLRAVLVGGACALVLSAGAAAAQSRNFDVPAGDLKAGLDAYIRQSGAQLVYQSDDVRGKRTAGLRGPASADAALDRLLAGSGLVATRDRSGAVMVTKRPQAMAATAAAEPAEVDQLVVTGSNIRGLKNATSPVTLFDREAIASTGAANVQEFLRSLPQNFAGGASGASQDGILGAGEKRNTNNEAASGVNLRGLGNKATLVLLDGHRMAPSAFGAFVDISAIPLSAVERIDVLTDGASSVYGADAVGGVINLILRKDYQGAESTVRVGSVTQGGYRQQMLSQLVGRSWTGGGALASLQYDHQRRMASDERSFTANVPRYTDIYPSYEKITAVFSGHQDLTTSLSLYGDALLGQTLMRRKNTLSAGSVDYGKILTEGTNLHGGLRYLVGGWRADLSGTFSSQLLKRRNDILTPARTGYRYGEIALKNSQDTRSIDLNLDGSLFDLPAGPVKLALGAGYRREEFASVIPYSVAINRYRATDRTVRAVYAEVAAPLIGEANALPLVRALDLSAAVRYDRYTAFGGTTNPKVGLRWEPAEGLALRGTWGTSFRAPSSDEVLNQAQGLTLFSYPFVAPNGVGTIPIFIQQGVTGAVGPEKADSLSFGLDYAPPGLAGARLQLNYYAIDYRDRIVTPAFDETALTHPEIYGALISTFASDAEALAYRTAFLAAGGQFLDYAGVSNIRYLYRANTINAASVKQSGLDGSASYAFTRGDDRYTLGVDVSYILKLTSRLAAGSQPQDILNNVGEANRLRLHGQAGWARGPFRANLLVNHVGPYHNGYVIPTQKVRAQTTADLVLNLRPEAEPGAPTAGLNVTLSVINIFDRKPPFVTPGGTLNTGVQYDAGNADARGRYVALEVRKSW